MSNWPSRPRNARLRQRHPISDGNSSSRRVGRRRDGKRTLAPDLVEAILGGWVDQRVMLERLEGPLPVGWEEQSMDLLCR
jgi:hypothetical protein